MRFWQFIEDILAVIGLLTIIGLAVFGAMNIAERSLAMPQAVPSVPFESRQSLSRLTHPVRCDATVGRRCYVASSTKAALKKEGK